MIPIPGITLTIDGDAVIIASAQPLNVLSSAVVGGELRAARHIINMHVDKAYACAQPEEDLRAFALRRGIAEPFVGLMTAAWTENAGVAFETRGEVAVAAIVTAGLGNLTAAGLDELPGAAIQRATPGTINTILLIDAALTPAAMANAIITATEAKTLLLVEHDLRTTEGHPASGTSTDSVVVACTGRGDSMSYSGPATTAGWLIGRTVRIALNESIVKRERTPH
jgi:iron complex transport system ATP-binding protein